MLRTSHFGRSPLRIGRVSVGIYLNVFLLPTLLPAPSSAQRTQVPLVDHWDVRQLADGESDVVALTRQAAITMHSATGAVVEDSFFVMPRYAAGPNEDDWYRPRGRYGDVTIDALNAEPITLKIEYCLGYVLCQ